MGASVPIYPIYQGETFFPLAHRSSSWRDYFLAVLPHLWIGLSAALTRVDFNASTTWFTQLGIYLRVGFLIACLVLLAYSWRRGWPLWSASWYFYAAWLGIIVFLSGVNRISPHAWVLNAVFILGGLGAMAVGYLFLYRASPLHALLAGLFLMPVATQFELESIPNNLEAFISVLFAGLAALVAIGIIRSQNWMVGVVLALLANLISGATLTYVSFYRSEIPNFYGDSFMEAILAFGFYFALAVALFIGPPIFWKGVDRLRRGRRRGRGSPGGTA